MKKFKIFLLILIFVFVGCKKNTIDLDEFIDIATYNGYIIEENKTGYETYSNIINVYYAVNRLNAYDIQFIKTDSADYAKKFFMLNVDDIRKNVETIDYIKSKSLSNYEYYHVENSDSYYLIIRNKENIIYVVAPINFINEIEEFLDELSLEY